MAIEKGGLKAEEVTGRASRKVVGVGHLRLESRNMRFLTSTSDLEVEWATGDYKQLAILGDKGSGLVRGRCRG